MQNVATNYLNKKRDFPPLPSVDMEVSYSPIPTSRKAKLSSSTITQKSTVHTTSESLSKPPLPTSGSNVDGSFQLFTDGTNGSPVSQIQLSQSSRQGAVSNVRSFQSPIISTNSPPPTPKINYQVIQLHLSIHLDQLVCHYQINQLQLVLT